MKREVNDNVDGFTVDVYAATFSGTVDIDLPDARYMRYDDELVIVATVRVKMPRLRESKAGNITRVNVLGIKEVGLVRSEQMKATLCERLGLNLDGQMRFEVEVPAAESEFDETEVISQPAETELRIVESEFDGDEPEEEVLLESSSELSSSIASHPSGNGDAETVMVPNPRKDNMLTGFLYGQ